VLQKLFEPTKFRKVASIIFMNCIKLLGVACIMQKYEYITHFSFLCSLTTSNDISEAKEVDKHETGHYQYQTMECREAQKRKQPSCVVLYTVVVPNLILLKNCMQHLSYLL
jgi:hypothetical protein